MTSSGETHPIDLPDGSNVTGKLLVIVATFRGNDASWPGGWTECFTVSNGTDPTLHVRWRSR